MFVGASLIRMHGMHARSKRRGRKARSPLRATSPQWSPQTFLALPPRCARPRSGHEGAHSGCLRGTSDPRCHPHRAPVRLRAIELAAVRRPQTSAPHWVHRFVCSLKWDPLRSLATSSDVHGRHAPINTHAGVYPSDRKESAMFLAAGTPPASVAMQSCSYLPTIMGQ